ncbi:MAG: helix-turn-helix transcriptional regulator [Reyranella sp.]|nr:helix-turn-helix transcriptional regulator [Reyranella sp.]
MARLPAARRKRIEARAAERIAEELALRDLRKALGRTQVEVARRLRISQVTLSDTERRGDVMLSTLRKYVGALGGKLELVARFPDRTAIRIAPMAENRSMATARKRRKRTASAA